MDSHHSEPIFTVTIEKGLADRHRMPIGQVIHVLNEVRQMLIEAGREIEKEHGRDPSKLDFGLEIVADKRGDAFRQGSLRAKIAITSNIEVGMEAAERILNTVHDLSAKRKPPASVASLQEPAKAKIMNRLDRMAFISERSKAEARFQVSVPRPLQPSQRKMRTSAVFGQIAVRKLATLREPIFSENGVTLYGKLVELKDKSQIEDTRGKFWGELWRDNGDRWRIEFSETDQAIAVPLFRHQVELCGTAYYFQTRAPKLVASRVQADEPRDYVYAFDQLYGANKTLYRADLQTLLRRRYGEQ